MKSGVPPPAPSASPPAAIRAPAGSPTCCWPTRLTRATWTNWRAAPVPHAAAQVGYASVPAFGAAFRQTFGMTPQAVRSKP
jgi:AraC-like DNA-binding protein